MPVGKKGDVGAFSWASTKAVHASGIKIRDRERKIRARKYA